MYFIYPQCGVYVFYISTVGGVLLLQYDCVMSLSAFGGQLLCTLHIHLESDCLSVGMHVCMHACVYVCKGISLCSVRLCSACAHDQVTPNAEQYSTTVVYVQLELESTQLLYAC